MPHRVAQALWATIATSILVLAARGLLMAQGTVVTGTATGACHVSPIVSDLDRAAHFYHDILGLDLVPSPPPGALPWDEDAGHLHLHGVPRARLRFIGARMPGIRCGVELVEINDISRTAVHRRIHDTGAVTLILLVRDIDDAFARLKQAGVAVVTAGGVPLAMSTVTNTRAIIVQDPDGHFVELAQLDPLPATSVPPGSNIIGIRLRVTVGDMDQTLKFYERTLGLSGTRGSFSTSHAVSAMMGLPDSEYRLTTIALPGSTLLLEFLELNGFDRTLTASHVQDPGSFRLQLNVRDIDAALASLTSAGSTVISTGGVPVSMAFNGRPWRLAIAPDPNNLFLIVQQPPTVPPPGP